jgi:hypothetical protein
LNARTRLDSAKPLRTDSFFTVTEERELLIRLATRPDGTFLKVNF